MPQIDVPEIELSERARAWADARFGSNTLLAIAQGEIVSEFELGTPEPKIENVLDIGFHTFVCCRDRQEFVLHPRDGRVLALDLCERREVALQTGPLAGRRIAIPRSPAEDAVT